KGNSEVINVGKPSSSEMTVQNLEEFLDAAPVFACGFLEVVEASLRAAGKLGGTAINCVGEGLDLIQQLFKFVEPEANLSHGGLVCLSIDLCSARSSARLDWMLAIDDSICAHGSSARASGLASVVQALTNLSENTAASGKAIFRIAWRSKTPFGSKSTSFCQS